MIYPFLPVFSRGLGVNLTQMSQAIALRSASGALGPFLGSIGDLRGRRAGMLLGLLLFIAGCALVLFIPTFPAFVAALILNLLGYFTFNPAMQAFLGDRVPYQQRGRALALPELGWSLSLILGMPVVALLIGRQGWQAPFAVLGLLGGVAFLFLAAWLPRSESTHNDQVGMWRTLRLVVTSAPALAGMLMGVASATSNELVNVIFGAWLETSFGVKIAALGVAAVVIGFAELSGELGSVGLVDRIGKGRAVAGALILNSLAALALPFLGSSLNGALVGLFFFYLTFEFSVVCSIPLITEILPQARATLMACTVAVISLGRALGDLLSPWLFSLQPDLPGASGFLLVCGMAVLFNLVALWALRAVLRRLTVKAVE